MLALEHIGAHSETTGAGMAQFASLLGADMVARQRKPWVARITGRCERYGLAREFVPCRITDYSRSNGVGSRGVVCRYILSPGVYEVNAWQSWRGRDRYFARVTDGGEVRRITREEVDAWLSEGLE